MPLPFSFRTTIKNFGTMALGKKRITEPTAEDEKLLSGIVEDSTDYVTVRGREWAVQWVRNRARRKVTDILLKEKDEDKVVCKCAAALRLNGYFKITFLYWWMWRWYYYVRQYGDGELLEFISMCKKKFQRKNT